MRCSISLHCHQYRHQHHVIIIIIKSFGLLLPCRIVSAWGLLRVTQFVRLSFMFRQCAVKATEEYTGQHQKKPCHVFTLFLAATVNFTMKFNGLDQWQLNDVDKCSLYRTKN